LPQRGDILVFRYPENPRINYIKRVVGVPGDLIRYENRQLYVNGEAVPIALQAQIPPGIPRIKIYTEKLGEVEYQIQHDLAVRPDSSGTWLVGEGQYFTLGDNRDNSRDSRYWNFVPENHIVGKAFAVWMHMPGWIPSFNHNRFLD
jgi:signal peptidase I